MLRGGPAELLQWGEAERGLLTAQFSGGGVFAYAGKSP